MYSLRTHVVKFRNEPYPKAVLIRYGSVACAVVDVMLVQSVFSTRYIAVFLFFLVEPKRYANLSLFHSLFIHSNCSGGNVSIPCSLQSFTTLSISLDICFVLYELLP